MCLSDCVASVITHRMLGPAAIIGLKVFTAIPAPREDHIRSLIEANQEFWEDLVNHPFPRQMARGTAPLNGFRHFMIVSRSIPASCAGLDPSYSKTPYTSSFTLE